MLRFTQTAHKNWAAASTLNETGTKVLWTETTTKKRQEGSENGNKENTTEDLPYNTILSKLHYEGTNFWNPGPGRYSPTSRLGGGTYCIV